MSIESGNRNNTVLRDQPVMLILIAIKDSLWLGKHWLIVIRRVEPCKSKEVAVKVEVIISACQSLRGSTLHSPEELRHPAAKLHQHHSLCITFIACFSPSLCMLTMSQ
jgi:hypothetical protein